MSDLWRCGNSNRAGRDDCGCGAAVARDRPVMDRRKFFGLALGGAATASVATAAARQTHRYNHYVPSRYSLPTTTTSEVLPRMATGLAVALDSALDLRHQQPGGVFPADWRARRDELGLFWWESPFYLTDHEFAEGPTDAMQYREAIKALIYRAQLDGVTSLYPTGLPGWPEGPLSSEARYGRAVARATVERRHARERWTLSFLGSR